MSKKNRSEKTTLRIQHDLSAGLLTLSAPASLFKRAWFSLCFDNKQRQLIAQVGSRLHQQSLEFPFSEIEELYLVVGPEGQGPLSVQLCVTKKQKEQELTFRVRDLDRYEEAKDLAFRIARTSAYPKQGASVYQESEPLEWGFYIESLDAKGQRTLRLLREAKPNSQAVPVLEDAPHYEQYSSNAPPPVAVPRKSPFVSQEDFLVTASLSALGFFVGISLIAFASPLPLLEVWPIFAGWFIVHMIWLVFFASLKTAHRVTKSFGMLGLVLGVGPMFVMIIMLGGWVLELIFGLAWAALLLWGIRYCFKL
jgi:hypothetical protein